MLGVVAPDIMNAVRTAGQAQSVAPLPESVEQLIKQAGGQPMEQAQEETAEPEAGA
jgi:hypothetical protein